MASRRPRLGQKMFARRVLTSYSRAFPPSTLRAQVRRSPRKRPAPELEDERVSGVEFLGSRADMVTARVGNDELEVSLLGSYGIEEAWATLDLLALAWEAGRSVDTPVELLRF